MMNDGTKIYDHNKYVQSNKLLLTFFLFAGSCCQQFYY